LTPDSDRVFASADEVPLVGTVPDMNTTGAGEFAIPSPATNGVRSATSPEKTSVGGRAARPFDHERVARAVRELLIGIGEDPDREGLRKTPDRVARAYREAVEGLGRDPVEVLTTVFDEGHDEMVLVRDIDFSSLCEHHLVVFAGKAHVAYIPNERGQITGLSKLARLVDLFARRPQVQERLTSQVADALVDVLDPSGVMVVVEAEHLCMSMRGVRKPGARTVTSAVRGQFLSPATRSEGMSLILSGR
jgi:GTP cyclohydrolase I